MYLRSSTHAEQCESHGIAEELRLFSQEFPTLRNFFSRRGPAQYCLERESNESRWGCIFINLLGKPTGQSASLFKGQLAVGHGQRLLRNDAFGTRIAFVRIGYVEQIKELLV